ncbi:hypothetical protein ACPV5Q_15730 [Vibrio astriarenae]
MSSSSFLQVDIPFNQRHTCWFCGEPSNDYIDFPKSQKAIARLEHQPLALPACSECSKFQYKDDILSIWRLRYHIKHALISKYAKHLGIGENWTEKELQESEFTGSLLGGFGESAWAMYEIAKERVSYKGWELTINDIALDGYDDTSGFEFDGVRYLSVNTCIDYFVKATGLDRELLIGLIDIVSTDRFAYALRIAQLNKNVSNRERAEILDEIATQETEQEEINSHTVQTELEITDVEEVVISGTTAPAFAIQWAITKNVKNLDDLCAIEDDYFDNFEHLGGPAAFMSYNGLQLYLEAREDKDWATENDPNSLLWQIG